MRTKRLGRTGIEIPIVGLGGANLGLPTQESAYLQHVADPKKFHADFDVGVATVVAALEQGIRLVDTAPKYMNGVSETMIGNAIRKNPILAQYCILTTKIGPLYGDHTFDYSYGAAMRCVSASRKRLDVTHIPIMYLHDPMGQSMDFVMSKKGAMEALRTLQRVKFIDYIGIAADDPETAADYIETGEFDVATVSGAWSLINQTAAKRILPAARKHNVGLVITTAIERGLLATGKLLLGAHYIQRSFSSECLAHVERIDSLCRKFNIPLLAAALQWATRDPQIAAAIPGARTPEEACMNAGAGTSEIPEEFWTALEPLICHFDCCI